MLKRKWLFLFRNNCAIFFKKIEIIQYCFYWYIYITIQMNMSNNILIDLVLWDDVLVFKCVGLYWTWLLLGPDRVELVTSTYKGAFHAPNHWTIRVFMWIWCTNKYICGATPVITLGYCEKREQLIITIRLQLIKINGWICFDKIVWVTTWFYL
jgi:hypothetical protein